MREWVLILVMAGCGGEERGPLAAPQVDAGADAAKVGLPPARPADAGPDAAPACMLGDDCGPGRSCKVPVWRDVEPPKMVTTLSCIEDGTGTQAQGCVRSEDCAAGTACEATTCMRLCYGGFEIGPPCPSGLMCRQAGTTLGARLWHLGVCAP